MESFGSLFATGTNFCRESRSDSHRSDFSTARMPPPDPDGIASPCINQCRLDARSGLCCGCLRTLDEIAAWGEASDAQRRAILDEIKQRERVFS